MHCINIIPANDTNGTHSNPENFSTKAGIKPGTSITTGQCTNHLTSIYEVYCAICLIELAFCSLISLSFTNKIKKIEIKNKTDHSSIFFFFCVKYIQQYLYMYKTKAITISQSTFIDLPSLYWIHSVRATPNEERLYAICCQHILRSACTSVQSGHSTMVSYIMYGLQRKYKGDNSVKTVLLPSILKGKISALLRVNSFLLEQTPFQKGKVNRKSQFTATDKALFSSEKCWYCSYWQWKHVVGTHLKRLGEALLMSTHNICIRREIQKILCGYPLIWSYDSCLPCTK